jgi:cell division protein ZapA
MADGETPRESGQRVQVEIAGRTYTLKGNRDPREVKRLASFVDERMAEISTRTQTADTTRVAILAALNIADELFRAQRGRPAAGDAPARDRELIKLLDEALSG